MRCPFCQEDHDRVVESRAAEDGASIRRRRECLSCNKRYTTYEKTETKIGTMVVKKDGSRVPYSRAKVEKGVQIACYKRAVPAHQIVDLVDQIEEQILHNHSLEVPSSNIGGMVIEGLNKLDRVALLRFASVYLNPEKIEDLLIEISPISDKTNAP